MSETHFERESENAVYGGEEVHYEEEDGSEEEEAEVAVADGHVYTTPGVCQPTVKEMILARGNSVLARCVYKAPDTRMGAMLTPLGKDPKEEHGETRRPQ